MKKLTMKQLLTTIALLTIAVFFGCGGHMSIGMGPTPTPTPVAGGAQSFISFHRSVPGGHSALSIGSTTASNEGLFKLETVFAAAAVRPQSFNGHCQTTPNVANNSEFVGADYFLFGAGQYSDMDCQFHANSLPEAGERINTAGALTHLECYASNIGTGPNSGICTAFLNGAPTALTCTLGATDHCAVDGNISTIDGDRVSIRVHNDKNDNFHNFGADLDKT